MADIVNIGTAANAGDGDTLRAAMAKINAAFAAGNDLVDLGAKGGFFEVPVVDGPKNYKFSITADSGISLAGTPTTGFGGIMRITNGGQFVVTFDAVFDVIGEITLTQAGFAELAYWSLEGFPAAGSVALEQVR